MTRLDNILIVNAQYSRTTLLILPFLTDQIDQIKINLAGGKHILWERKGMAEAWEDSRI